jgi:SAM-dependent methyltransferase
LERNNKRALTVLACLLACSSSMPAAQRPPGGLPVAPLPEPQKPKASLFGPQDLGLLEAPDRAQWQKPDQIMDALGIADGSIVAEVGAAGGWFTIKLARRVGPNGRVYAEDIQPLMIEQINRRVQRENLPNVVTVLGTGNDPVLPHGLDAVLISDAYPEMEDPVTLLKHVAESLKAQGRVGIVDFKPGASGPGPKPSERIDPQVVINAAGAAGLQLTAREELPFQFLLVFRKRSPPRGEVSFAPVSLTPLR